MLIHNLVVPAIAALSLSMLVNTPLAAASPSYTEPASCSPKSEPVTDYMSAVKQSQDHKLIEKVTVMGIEVERYDDCEAAVFAPQTAQHPRAKLGFIYCWDGYASTQLTAPSNAALYNGQEIYRGFNILADLEYGNDCMSEMLVPLSEFE